MNAKVIKELIGFIARANVSEVTIKLDELELSVKKGQSKTVVSNPEVSLSEVDLPVETPVLETPQPATPPPPPAPSPSSKTLNSPMIGTFYTSKNPESPAFVKVGDVIKKGDIIGIVEAMKLFNEIEAEEGGKVLEILVDNASPVEFDQPLIRVEPV